MDLRPLRSLDQEAYQILGEAQKEYALADDAFANFKEAGVLLGIPPRKVLQVYMYKHLASIFRGVTVRDSMRGRIIDAMNYLRLLYLMDREEIEIAGTDQSGSDLSALPTGGLPEMSCFVGLRKTLEKERIQSKDSYPHR